MKFTDRFFRLPIRFTDEYSIIKINEEIQENKKLPDEQPMVNSIDSVYRLPFGEVDGWQEVNPPETKFDDILNGERKGFECTMVYTKTHGDLLCSWNIDKFEKKLDEYHDKMTKYFESLKKPESNSINP